MRIALLIFLAQGVAFAAAPSPPIVGTYGSLSYVEEAGDVIGTVITITHRGGRFEVTYQEAEGEPGPKYHVPAVVNGATISFQLPPLKLDDYKDGELVGTSEMKRPLYRGTITSEGLRGGFVGEQEELLPRRPIGKKGSKGT